MTVDDLQPKLVAQLRRVILRILQRDSPITRTNLSVQVRPRSENWDIVLDDLVDRGLVKREPVIKDNGRAAVTYSFIQPDTEAAFDDMTPEEVNEYVLAVSRPAIDTTALSA
jgi:predicted ArsR family transcriptional regulator